MRLTLEAPQRIDAGTVTVRGTPRRREAVRARLRDEAGHAGVGEAMPLPGYSLEDADHVCAVLAPLAGDWPDADPVETVGPAAIAATLAPHAAALAGSAGARFALEVALLDLLSRRAGIDAASWLAAGRALQPVAVSVLLPDDEASAPAAAAEAARQGHTVLKLKVGRADRSPEQELALLRAVRQAVDAVAGPGRVRLRLDANGALAPAEVPGRFEAWAALGVEVVEEPVAGAALLALPALPLPWAADESLRDPALAAALLALPPGRGPAALVLKPAELGLLRALELARAGAARGLGLIVTHSFDGAIGLAAAGTLAQALPVPPWACGLAPHAGLRDAVADPAALHRAA